MDLNPINVAEYFAVARERYRIKLAKDAGQPAPWTDDKHLRAWRFCQVHREDDKTTAWFRENIREHLSGLAVLRATVYFRWFNRIETGEVILDELLGPWNTKVVREKLYHERVVKGLPVVTGAYIIKAHEGMSKLDGILKAIDEAAPQLAAIHERWHSIPKYDLTLERATADLTEIFYLGKFMAYEAVSDLRWTDLLCFAHDINTWANPGPGCARGLGWLCREPDAPMPEQKVRPTQAARRTRMLELMRELLVQSRMDNWPSHWRPWEMREVEHWCCEYDKYRRAKAGLDLKRRYQ